MGWIEEVKELDPHVEDTATALKESVIKEAGYPEPAAELFVGIFKKTWAAWEMDRLLAIASEAERRWDIELQVHHCSVCGIIAEVGKPSLHSRACPYHPDWRPE